MKRRYLWTENWHRKWPFPYRTQFPYHFRVGYNKHCLSLSMSLQHETICHDDNARPTLHVGIPDDRRGRSIQRGVYDFRTISDLRMRRRPKIPSRSGQVTAITVFLNRREQNCNPCKGAPRIQVSLGLRAGLFRSVTCVGLRVQPPRILCGRSRRRQER